MRHKIMIKVTWEWSILLLLLAQVFIVQWLAITYYYCVVIDAILVAYLITHRKRIHRANISGIPFYLLCIYCVFQVVRPGAQLKTLYNNCLYVITSALIMVTVCSLYSNYDRIEKTFRKLFPLINCYLIINIPVLLIQLGGNVTLSGRHAIENTNPYKPDLICGLFGYNGTPMLTMFVSFCFIYNYWYSRYYLRKHFVLFWVYFGITFLFYLYIAIPSQNTGYYLVLAMCMTVYFLNMHNNYQRIKQRIKSGFRGIVISIVAIITLVLGYKNNNVINSAINKVIDNFNIGTTSYYITGRYISGSSERFAMITFFFTSDINKLFGVGIGAMAWKERLGFGFLHFGQSDMGTFLIVGGIVFVVLLFMIFIDCIHAIEKPAFITACMCILLFFLMVFTQLYTTISIMISFMLFILTCAMEKVNE